MLYIPRYMYTFTVITTYDDDEQDFFEIEMDSEDVKNETSFLFTLFRDENNLKSIVKYSICQKITNTTPLLDFLGKRFGKYYFTEEDPAALTIMNEYLTHK